MGRDVVGTKMRVHWNISVENGRRFAEKLVPIAGKSIEIMLSLQKKWPEKRLTGGGWWWWVVRLVKGVRGRVNRWW